MADEILRSKHAFGSSELVEQKLAEGVIDERDILFLDEETDSPKIGWITKSGKPVIVPSGKTDLSELEADVAKLEKDSKDVTEKLEELSLDIEGFEDSYEKTKYEISDIPVGTLVTYRENEIRIMCPKDVEWTHQNVGTGGDTDSYYVTFKTYVPNDNVVGYIEHLGGQVDSEILTNFSTDEYGRRYQPTWLAIAKYDKTTDTWSYYGDKSSGEKFIGWDYQIDWFNADGVMIASDSIRINLSNELCHYSSEPYYIDKAIKTANSYTDEQITAILNSMAIVEF